MLYSFISLSPIVTWFWTVMWLGGFKVGFSIILVGYESSLSDSSKNKKSRIFQRSIIFAGLCSRRDMVDFLMDIANHLRCFGIGRFSWHIFGKRFMIFLRVSFQLVCKELDDYLYSLSCFFSLSSFCLGGSLTHCWCTFTHTLTIFLLFIQENHKNFDLRNLKNKHTFAEDPNIQVLLMVNNRILKIFEQNAACPIYHLETWRIDCLQLIS